VEDGDESRSWLVVLVHDGGITRRRSPGMDGGAALGHTAVIVGFRRTHVLFASERHAILRGGVSETVAQAGA